MKKIKEGDENKFKRKFHKDLAEQLQNIIK